MDILIVAGAKINWLVNYIICTQPHETVYLSESNPFHYFLGETGRFVFVGIKGLPRIVIDVGSD